MPGPMTSCLLGSLRKGLRVGLASGLMLAAAASIPTGIAMTSPPGNGPSPLHQATSGGMLLSLFPAQTEVMRLVPGRSYRLAKELREPLKIRNMSDQTVEVELKALSLSEAGIRLEAGCADLLGLGKVAISPATFSLEPGEERTVDGTLSLLKRGPKGKALMCVIAATVAHHETKTETQTYSRIYVRAR